MPRIQLRVNFRPGQRGSTMSAFTNRRHCATIAFVGQVASGCIARSGRSWEVPFGGGLANIKTAMSHYRIPQGNIIQFITGSGTSSIGEEFNLPGTPSSYPTVPFPNQGTTTRYKQTNGPTVIVHSQDTTQTDAQRLHDLQQQYQAIQAQINAQKNGN